MLLASRVRQARGAIQRQLQLPTGPVATPSTLLAGVRAATVTVLPIVLAAVTGESSLVWAALGGWLSTFADAGGAYRARARALLAFAALGTASVFVGAVVGRVPPAAVLLVFVWACGGAMLRLFGDAATSVGNLAAVTFVVSLATPAAPGPSAARAALFAAGCLLALVLSVVVWPLRPWGPARAAVAACYDRLADLARGVGAALDAAPAGGEPWHALARRDHAPVRQAIETARLTLGETRRGRLGGSRRGDDLVVLLGTADLLFEALVAAGEEVESAARLASGARSRAADSAPGIDTTDARLLAALAAAVGSIGDALAALAGRVPAPSERRVAPDDRRLRDRAVLGVWGAVEASERRLGAGAPRLAHATQAAAILEHAATLVDLASDAVGSLVEAPAAERAIIDAGPPESAAGGAWRTVRANLTADSLVLRHAARAGLVAAIATAAAFATRLPHASWVTTTALIVLQPYAGVTRRRGVERVTWTVLGGLVAAALAALVHDRLLIAAVMFPLSVAAIAVRAAHYGLFTFFLTPVFVLLAEPAAGDWRLAALRAADTLAGGLLALAATRALWPSPEHRRLPSELAALVDAVHAYVRQIEAPTLGLAPGDAGGVAAARRRVGLAANNADAAFQRFVAEPPGPLTEVEALMTVLTFARRLTAAATVLAVGLGRPAGSGAVAERARLARAVDATLGELAAAVREERAPPPLADAVARFSRGRGDHAGRDPRTFRSTLELPVAGVGLERVARQTGVLHAAVTRAFGGLTSAA